MSPTAPTTTPAKNSATSASLSPTEEKSFFTRPNSVSVVVVGMLSLDRMVLLDGWPNHLRTEYVDSGSNVDPVYEAKNVFTHLTSTTKRSGDACREMLGKLKFTQIMMDGTIGELSGGWQMKLRLAKAVLIDADILLLDEPTNHLDKGTV
eukprot:14513770-Ditylum_brightwellii.AAC.1